MKNEKKNNRKRNDGNKLESTNSIKVEIEMLANEPDVLTVGDMERLLGVSRSTLYRWSKNNQLPSLKLGATILFLKEQIRNFLIAKLTQPTE